MKARDHKKKLSNAWHIEIPPSITAKRMILMKAKLISMLLRALMVNPTALSILE